MAGVMAGYLMFAPAGAACSLDSDLPVTFFAVPAIAWPAAVASCPMPRAVLHAPIAKGSMRTRHMISNFIGILPTA